MTPEGKVLSRDLTHQLNTAIQFLVECRPLSVSMGNAIKFVKLQVCLCNFGPYYVRLIAEHAGCFGAENSLETGMASNWLMCLPVAFLHVILHAHADSGGQQASQVHAVLTHDCAAGQQSRSWHSTGRRKEGPDREN